MTEFAIPVRERRDEMSGVRRALMVCYMFALGFLHIGMIGLYEASFMPWLFYEYVLDTKALFVYAVCIMAALVPVNWVTFIRLRSLRPEGTVIKPTVPAIARCVFWSLLLLFVLVATPVLAPYYMPPHITNQSGIGWMVLCMIGGLVLWGLYFTGFGLWWSWSEMKHVPAVPAVPSSAIADDITEPIPVQALPAPALQLTHKVDNLPSGLNLLKIVFGLLVLFIIIDKIKERRKKH